MPYDAARLIRHRADRMAFIAAIAKASQPIAEASRRQRQLRQPPPLPHFLEADASRCLCFAAAAEASIARAEAINSQPVISWALAATEFAAADVTAADCHSHCRRQAASHTPASHCHWPLIRRIRLKKAIEPLR